MWQHILLCAWIKLQCCHVLFFSENYPVLWSVGDSDTRRTCVLQKRPCPEEGYSPVCVQRLHVSHGDQRGQKSAQYPCISGLAHVYSKLSHFHQRFNRLAQKMLLSSQLISPILSVIICAFSLWSVCSEFQDQLWSFNYSKWRHDLVSFGVFLVIQKCKKK